MFPPRAKDRTLYERLRWSIASSSGWTFARERLARAADVTTGGWPGCRNIGLTLLSVIPGFGHFCVTGNRLLGLQILLGSLAAVVLAALLYRTRLADALALGVVGASIYSVWAAICEISARLRRGTGQPVPQFAILMLVIAAYFGSYTVGAVALRDTIWAERIAGEPNVAALSRGDTLLVRRMASYSRGDIVISASGTLAGAIVGIPGDFIEVRDGIYVNGIRTNILLPNIDWIEPGRHFLRLHEDHYWIMPVVQGDAQVPAHTLISTGTIGGPGIRGRAIAIVAPPHRRQLLTRTNFFREHN